MCNLFNILWFCKVEVFFVIFWFVVRECNNCCIILLEWVFGKLLVNWIFLGWVIVFIFLIMCCFNFFFKFLLGFCFFFKFIKVIIFLFLILLGLLIIAVFVIVGWDINVDLIFIVFRWWFVILIILLIWFII